jgi:cytochrome c oxidase cbb3-type subunit 4
MYKEVLRSIEGIGMYPLISLVVFMLFFITVFLRVLVVRKAEAAHMAALPLHDGESSTPDTGAH